VVVKQLGNITSKKIRKKQYPKTSSLSQRHPIFTHSHQQDPRYAHQREQEKDICSGGKGGYERRSRRKTDKSRKGEEE